MMIVLPNVEQNRYFLDLRLPAKFTVRTGSSYSGQNVVERKVNLPVATVKGIDMAISDLEMALSLDDFSKTILEPAMAQLAAQLNMTQSMRYISTFLIMLVLYLLS